MDEINFIQRQPTHDHDNKQNNRRRQRLKHHNYVMSSIFTHWTIITISHFIRLPSSLIQKTCHFIFEPGTSRSINDRAWCDIFCQLKCTFCNVLRRVPMLTDPMKDQEQQDHSHASSSHECDGAYPILLFNFCKKIQHMFFSSY